MKNLFNHLSFSFIILILVSSCNNKINSSEEENTGFAIETEFLLKKEESAKMKNEDLSISVLEIKDSRCPVGVNCIRAGEIKFNIIIKNKDKEKTVELSHPAKKGSRLIDNINFEGYNIKLIKANQANKGNMDDNATLGGIFMVSPEKSSNENSNNY